VIETVQKAIEFLGSYPLWVRIVAAVPVISIVALVLLLLFVPRSDAESGLLFINDINELWHPLSKDLRSAKNGQKRLEILGLTLYAAWGQISPWLEEPDTRDWEIDVYCLSPVAARGALAPLIPTQWGDDAESKSQAITKFLAGHKGDLEARNVNISLHHYSSFPAVHGFHLGSGKIYMSIARWSTSSGQLEYGAHPYEVIAFTDQSARAKAYRAAFMNWLQRAKKG
jgi:hypothetical protein